MSGTMPKAMAVMVAAAGIASLSMKHARDEMEKLTPLLPADPDVPPARLSVDPNHEDYHPGYFRVGVRFNGEERNDVQWYDSVYGLITTTSSPKSRQEGKVETYWRYPETRQQRRARERWEQKHR